VVEKNSRTVLVAAVLATLGTFGVVTTLSIHNNTLALSSDSSTTNTLDRFGVKEIYQTKDNKEWYVNMADPKNDPNFRNLNNINFAQNSDGSWRVSGGQIRMEAWSPEDQKWQNVEITEYAKIESGSNDLLQLYSRGGHHTSKDPCMGSAYKARLYGNGEAAWVKEVTHPAYSGNRGTVQATDSIQGKWIGFKAVIYNVVENGNTYVRLESYVDDSVTDANGNLVVKNNWKLASVVEDKGGWSTNNSDFDPNCGRSRDEILTGAGGTATQNIAAFRSDDLTWDFKYLSVREINPLQSVQLPQSSLLTVTNTTTPLTTEINNDIIGTNIPATNNVLGQSDCVYNMTGCTILVREQFPNVDRSITNISAVKLSFTKIGNNNGNIIIAISQDGHVLGSGTVNTDQFQPYADALGTVTIYPDANVEGRSFDVAVLTSETPEIAIGSVSVQ